MLNVHAQSQNWTSGVISGLVHTFTCNCLQNPILFLHCTCNNHYCANRKADAPRNRLKMKTSNELPIS